jgi:hypothetical protein
LSFTNPTAPKQFIDVMDKTIDLCSLSNANRQSFLSRVMLEELEKSVKIKCPMKRVSCEVFFDSIIENRPFSGNNSQIKKF